MRDVRVIAPFVFALTLVASPGLLAAQSHDLSAVDREPFEKLAADVDEAWNARDARAFAEFFTADGDLQYWTGKIIAGRENIESAYSSTVFPGMSPSMRHTATLERARLVKPDVGIGDGFVTIAGTSGPDGPPVEMHLLFSCVAVNQDGQWRIAALRLMMPQKE